MPDDLIFRHRQRLKHHFINTSKVLLYGYHKLSDAAKITYQVIDGFDWEDKATGESKGYAFPAAETIAKIRDISVRTVQRHISELEEAGLLTRTRRKHKASVLYIEDVSQVEIDRYLARFVDKTQDMKPADNHDKSDNHHRSQKGRGVASSKSKAPVPVIRNDKSVVSPEPAQTTDLSLDYREEKEGKKKNVNVEKSASKGMQSMQAILDEYTAKAKPERGRGVRSERKAKRDYLAQTLVQEFDDPDGLGCYRHIADKLPESVIYRLKAEVKETAQLGKIRTSRAALFVSAAKRYARDHSIPLGFEKRMSDRSVYQPPAAGP